MRKKKVEKEGDKKRREQRKLRGRGRIEEGTKGSKSKKDEVELRKV